MALILTALILRYTKIGLYLKAIGNNPSASYLFHIIRDGVDLLRFFILVGKTAIVAVKDDYAVLTQIFASSCSKTTAHGSRCTIHV
jgi:ribose/xylose/arabinose/galactoside ABC-type transport system permease subunit